ncbi:helix-turn-helix domain-containing protein [Candidatus Poriferisodalis sp.]|uniref:helix-turn-helix domain-containing protein n=1 Tax=Candidatus Poriferisodalis sp. TaxID=3101277 RepID=UPI003B0297D7
MATLDELLDGDLESASEAAARAFPDVVAALDVLVKGLDRDGDLATIRRYWWQIDTVSRTLADLPRREPDFTTYVSRTLLANLSRRSAAETYWAAPSADGIGALTVLVDRLRGAVRGLPHECTKPRLGIDEHRFAWLLKSFSDIELEQRYAEPLRRAMAILDLSSRDVAEMMGVTRQAIEKWLLAGPPPDRLAKVGALAQIADILQHRLRAGMPAAVARRHADAYSGRSMLEVIADGEHEWLADSVRASFDYATVA